MFLTVTMSLLEGFSTTFKIFFLTLVFALPLGLIISFGSMSKIRPIKWLVKTFVWIIRGTPLMLSPIVIYYGPGHDWKLGSGFPTTPIFWWSSLPHGRFSTDSWRL